LALEDRSDQLLLLVLEDQSAPELQYFPESLELQLNPEALFDLALRSILEALFDPELLSALANLSDQPHL
jgi:hypothetical protein